MSSVTFPRESAESFQTGGPLHLVLNPGLVEPKDLVDDVVEDALLAPPVPSHDDVLLLLAPAEDAHVEVAWETVVPLVVLTSFRVPTIDFRVARKFYILEAGKISYDLNLKYIISTLSSHSLILRPHLGQYSCCSLDLASKRPKLSCIHESLKYFF